MQVVGATLAAIGAVASNRISFLLTLFVTQMAISASGEFPAPGIPCRHCRAMANGRDLYDGVEGEEFMEIGLTIDLRALVHMKIDKSRMFG